MIHTPTNQIPPLGERGFTLVEMLVVLTLVALLSVVAIGQLGRKPAFVTKGAQLTELRDSITIARQRSASTGRPITLASSALGKGASYRPGGVAPDVDALTVYPDGSTSGGMLFIADRPVASIDWLTGEVRDVAR